MHSITEFLSQFLTSSQGDLGGFDALAAIAIAYLGGVLSSLTPCVYPMIPITISVVGGIGATKRSWRDVFLKGLAYVGGMTLIYSFLGVLAGISGQVFGSFTNNSGGYLTLGVIMTLASLVLLDVLYFDPLVLWERIKRKFRPKDNGLSPSRAIIQKEITFVSSFFLGASSGFIAAPCTTPVLTSILAYIAKTKSVGLGFVLMFSFSLGLGTLLLLLAIFAGALQIMPRSGQWMKTVKTASGLILLAFAEYLIYRAGSFGG